MTPPLSLRDVDGAREIIALDEELITSKQCYSGRVTLFLNLGPNLHITIGSRCVNKRRLPSVTIRAVDVIRPSVAPALADRLSAYQGALDAMQPDPTA